MTEDPPPGARCAPATRRNRDAILEVLRRHAPTRGVALEIAAGTGEHAVHFARAFPELDWRPTDTDAEARASIAAWRADRGSPNLQAPVALDASRPETWPVAAADLVLAINMIHISPWAATEGLMRGAAAVLPPGGILFLYGPYRETDVPTAPSNLAFDDSLTARDPAWGLRDLGEVTALAAAHGLARIDRVEMPANNLSVVFRRA
jgi:SAM-dependent methyltransferase